ncbi:TetR/AcrR family transcriptional regulator [Thalassotalea atypica]|uniref:TetR/AcrR family transcriptional regulator n=1 Tax=Thalassotalea atypica TaxID=2054316 RepID=UPI0025722538|nr:TetR/AcrR family transcriptional regulator [Thalassotalea atypica]
MQTRLKNRKEQIVSTALELLQTHGYENFSYLDIANKLGITKASVHHHFPKKPDLGVALCEAIQTWHAGEFGKILTMHCTAKEKLDTYINAMLRFSCGKNKICPLSSLQADIPSLPDGMKNALKKLDEHELGFISQILEQGLEDGTFNFPGAASSQAVLLVLSCKGALQYSRLHGNEMFEQTIHQMNTLLVTNT